MIFTKPAHRVVAGAPPAGGKPTQAFSPNTGYANYPNLSAHFFTNLISGQTPYVEDSIAGRADFNQVNGNFGAYPEGEGYEVFIQNSGFGGSNDATTVGTGSFAAVFEFTMTRVSTSFIYMMGWGTDHNECFGPRNAACSEEGLFYSGSAYCLGSIGSGAVHRIAAKMYRKSGGSELSIALDGVMVHDQLAVDINRGSQVFNVGRNLRGRNERLWCSGLWEWTQPFDGADPLPDAAMLELSTDPWPHLAVLD